MYYCPVCFSRSAFMVFYRLSSEDLIIFSSKLHLN
jgi:hypothetical protein